MQSGTFPPPGIFGAKLTQLSLVLQQARANLITPTTLQADFRASHTTMDTLSTKSSCSPYRAGLHSDFVSTLPALELLHVTANISLTEAHKMDSNYRRFMSFLLSSLTSALSLRVVSLKAVLFGSSLDPRDHPSRSEIARILCYKEMQEQLRALPSNPRIHVHVEDGLAAPSKFTIIEPWHWYILDRFPRLRDRLCISIHCK